MMKNKAFLWPQPKLNEIPKSEIRNCNNKKEIRWSLRMKRPK
jgi:hypothetical protein